MKVMPSTRRGIYHARCKNRLSNAFADAMVIAVINDSSRGERFLVSKTDITSKVKIKN